MKSGLDAGLLEMKCEQCISLNKDKAVRPCSECSYRPHDICCVDKFEQRIPDEEIAELMKEFNRNAIMQERKTQ